MKTIKQRMREIASGLLALALLAGIPSAALADGDGSMIPPPPAEQGAPQPETGTDVPATAEPEITGPETVVPGFSEPETVQPETAVPPLVDEPAPETYAAVSEPAYPEQTEVAYDENQCPAWDDPLYYKQQDQISTVSVTSDSFERYTPRALTGNEVLRRGVDVSEYQGSISWTGAANSGVAFAIVRVALRGSTTGYLYKDSHYAQNLTGARAAGLKVGAYIFSQATTVEEAREEARYLIDAVKGYTIDLPLVFDFEEVSGSSRRLKMNTMDRQLKTDICKAFCEEVEAAGYQSMVYSNPNTLNNHLYRSQLGRLWLAHFTTRTAYPGPYEYWQCGIGYVDGVSGQVDLDFWFDPSGVSVPPIDENETTPTATPAATPTPSAAPTATPVPTPTPTPTAVPTVTPTPPIATPPAAVPPQGVTNPFKDVASGKWYYDSVMWAYGKGVVNGLSDSSFGPTATATRGQLVAMLYRMMGQPAVSGTAPFTDLKEDYYSNAVTWAANNGIVSGFSQTVFAPNNKITREQLATMLYRMAGSPAVSGDLGRFTDAGTIESYARSAMIWAVEKGIVTGYENNTLKPDCSATRAEVCTMLSRFAALG